MNNEENNKNGALNSTSNIHLTPFEQQLAQFFPDVFALLMLGKAIEHGGGGESHIWDIVDQLIEMNQTFSSGTIFIHYNKGRIDGLDVKRDHLAFKKRNNF